MDIRNLGYSALFARGANAAVAAQTAVNGVAFDTLQAGGPFDNFLVIAALGALTASQVTSLKIQGSVDGTNNWTDLVGTTQGPVADTDGNKLLVVDVFRPQGFRYLRGVVTRGTANAVVDAIIYIGYNAHSVPITSQDSTVAVPAATAVPALVKSYPTA